MSDIGRTNLFAAEQVFKLGSQLITNTAQANGVSTVSNDLFNNNATVLGLCTLGNNDYRVVKSLCVTGLDNLNYLVNVIRNFRQKNDVSTAGKSALKSEPAAVSTHNLKNLHSIV